MSTAGLETSNFLARLHVRPRLSGKSGTQPQCCLSSTKRQAARCKVTLLSTLRRVLCGEIIKKKVKLPAPSGLCASATLSHLQSEQGVKS